MIQLLAAPVRLTSDGWNHHVMAAAHNNRSPDGRGDAFVIAHLAAGARLAGC
jgi:hypothetical protein